MTRLRRRALLAALAGGTTALAGCQARWGPPDDPGDDETDEPATRPPTSEPPGTHTDPATTEPGPPNVGDGFGTAVALETGPRSVALASNYYSRDDGVAVQAAFASPADGAGPTRVEAVLEYRPREPDAGSVTLDLDAVPVVGDPRVASAEDGGRSPLLFAPTEDNELAEYVPGYERGPDGYWHATETPGSWLPDSVDLAPGDWLACETHLLAHPETVGFPTGRYPTAPTGDVPELVVWDSDRPGPTTDSRFAGRDPPPVDGSAVQWYHDATPATPSYLEPETEAAALPADVTLTMVNHTTESLECGHWQVAKLVDGAWYPIGPYVHTADCRVLEPGGRTRRTFHLAHEAPSSDSGQSIETTAFGYLGGGTYGVTVGFGHDTGTSGALLALDAPELTLAADEGTTTHRDSDGVTVTSPARAEADTPATLTLTPGDQPDGRLIAEQLYRRRYAALRNGLAHWTDDVARLVVETSERAVDDALGYDTQSATVAYRDHVVHVAADREA
jgi:hypothetical protein